VQEFALQTLRSTRPGNAKLALFQWWVQLLNRPPARASCCAKQSSGALVGIQCWHRLAVSCRHCPFVTRPAVLVGLIATFYVSAGFATAQRDASANANAMVLHGNAAKTCGGFALAMCGLALLQGWCRREPRVNGVSGWLPAGSALVFVVLELIAWNNLYDIRYRPSAATGTGNSTPLCHTPVLSFQCGF
jgi:hypothetical protein